MANILSKAASLVWPNRCIFCGAAAPGQKFICPSCVKKLPLVDERFCRTCGRPKIACVCGLGDPNPAKWYIAALWYTPSVKRAISAFKFGGKKQAGVFFADLMVDAMMDYLGELPAFDYITCVPMHHERLRERGYNQAAVLAEELSHRMSGEYAPELLQRKNIFTQHTLSGRFRRLDAKTDFSVIQGDRVVGKRILLVDDVFTTGSTMRQCAWSLKDAGSGEICCLAVTTTPKKR